MMTRDEKTVQTPLVPDHERDSRALKGKARKPYSSPRLEFCGALSSTVMGIGGSREDAGQGFDTKLGQG